MLLKIFAVFLLLLVAVLAIFYYLIFLKPRVRAKLDFDPEYEKERAANYPPPYPNGWFCLCSSDQVKKGQVIQVDALGQKFAVFRGENGVVGVMDVYCPHLNANLSNGKVKGNHLVCPFHAWEFDANGQCAHIPYCDKIPPQAAAKTWTIKENWGLVLVWYHAEGEAPSWHTEGYLKELEQYKFHSKTSDVLRIHLQDFAENGADYAHFSYVHNLITIPLFKELVNVKHQVEITFSEGHEKHMASFTNIADLAWKHNDQIIPHAGGKAVVTFYGPGFLVFQFSTKVGNMLLVKTFTPLGLLKVRMDDYVYAPKGTWNLAIKYLLGEAAAQFHDDINIWEQKNFAIKPLLVKGDGPIMKMRQWYSQFYTTSSYINQQQLANANITPKPVEVVSSN
jgi:cholesterol 7-dehydrogenase